MEIERKFLVKIVPQDLYEYPSQNILQSYINYSPVIRIRKIGQKYYLTCKGKGTLSRDEWEIEISKDEYQNLSKKIEGNSIRKSRFFITIECGIVVELDVYYDNLEGLITLEVEFDTIEEANNFEPSSWFGEEITEDTRYANSNLSKINNHDEKFW